MIAVVKLALHLPMKAIFRAILRFAYATVNFTI